MYSYTERNGARSTIILRHVINVFQKDADDTFEVYLDGSPLTPIEVPSECYDGFMEKLGEYVVKQ